MSAYTSVTQPPLPPPPKPPAPHHSFSWCVWVRRITLVGISQVIKAATLAWTLKGKDLHMLDNAKRNDVTDIINALKIQFRDDTYPKFWRSICAGFDILVISLAWRYPICTFWSNSIMDWRFGFEKTLILQFWIILWGSIWAFSFFPWWQYSIRTLWSDSFMDFLRHFPYSLFSLPSVSLGYGRSKYLL